MINKNTLLLLVAISPVFLLGGCNFLGSSLPSTELVRNNIKTQLRTDFVASYDMSEINTKIVPLDPSHIVAEFSFATTTKDNLYRSFVFASPEWQDGFQKAGGDIASFDNAVKALAALPAEIKIGFIPPKLERKNLLALTVPKGSTTTWAGKLPAERVADAWKFGRFSSFESIESVKTGNLRSQLSQDAVTEGQEADAYFAELKKVTDDFVVATKEKQAAYEATLAARVKEGQEAKEKYVAGYRAAVAAGRKYQGAYTRYDEPVAVALIITEFSEESGVFRGRFETVRPDQRVGTDIKGVLNFGAKLEDKFPVKLTLVETGAKPDFERKSPPKLFTPFYEGDKIELQLQDGALVSGKKGKEMHSLKLTP